MTKKFEQVYARAQTAPEDFWVEAAEALDWDRKWDKVLDDSAVPFYRWFKGGMLNTCHNALDRHVEGGRGNDAAGDGRTTLGGRLWLGYLITTRSLRPFVGVGGGPEVVLGENGAALPVFYAGWKNSMPGAGRIRT